MKKGFTFIELLIVIAIVLVLVVASAPIYGNLQVSAQLNESTSLIIQTLRTAKARSIAGINNDIHGVSFQIDKFTLFQSSPGDIPLRNIPAGSVNSSWPILGTARLLLLFGQPPLKDLLRLQPLQFPDHGYSLLLILLPGRQEG